MIREIANIFLSEFSSSAECVMAGRRVKRTSPFSLYETDIYRL